MITNINLLGNSAAEIERLFGDDAYSAGEEIRLAEVGKLKVIIEIRPVLEDGRVVRRGIIVETEDGRQHNLLVAQRDPKELKLVVI